MTRPSRLAVVGLLLTFSACASAAEFAEVKPAAPVAPAEVVTTLFLIGDAGAPNPAGEPVLKALAQQVGEAAGEPIIVFLGDNIYPAGLPAEGAPTRATAEQRLRDQVDVGVRTRTRTFFVPGNHDWEYMGVGGWDAIRRQGAFIKARGGRFVRLVPEGGCPGPVSVDVGTRLRLIMLDTQWWLHEGPRPLEPKSECAEDSPQEVVNSLSSALASSDGRHVVVLGHHPLASGGEHGGHFGLLPHFFPLRAFRSWLWIPLPVLGSYLPLSRKQGASNQDLSGPKYRLMRRAFDDVFKPFRPLVYAAGHDHDLQVIRGETVRHILVSGSGIYGHVSQVARRGRTRFAASVSGYQRLEFLRDGRVRLGVITVDGNARVTEAFSMFLQ
jgi:hypothetical protein